MDFIFMLTKNDETVPNALAVFEEIRDTAVRYVGFKDVGLPVAELKRLAEAIHASGREVFLEVVSLDREAEIRSASAALEIGVDWLLGGTRPADVLPVIAGSGVRYCPFPGRIVGHPSLLRGTVEEIAASARALSETEGVYGLDLLAYRFNGDVPLLVRRVLESVRVPVIAAGSVDSVARVRELGRGSHQSSGFFGRAGRS
ncbi:MAG: 4-hydroxythreonine-4-phosphate dehydrogenase [Parvularculaceae bacterium]|nr:4-hydroxythreonine-4-phosphate dehydrogenase [Parvularculaceae bacterium]